jgi:hypothetical protein
MLISAWYNVLAHTALASETAGVPVYGIGHSMGSLIHLLISARYAVQRQGNVLMGYNNMSAADVIPFMYPIIAQPARFVEPLLTQIAASPVRTTIEAAQETIRGLSPGVMKQLIGALEQFVPQAMDVAQGRQEFSPSPEETKNLIKSYYVVSRNLLLRFKSDEMDETNDLATLLQTSPAVGSDLDLTVRTLPGDFMRPMHQAVVDLPPEVARLANETVAQGGMFVGRMAGVAAQMGAHQATQPLYDLSKGVSSLANAFGGQVGGPVTDSMQGLADEVAAWMGVGSVVVSGKRALPASNVPPSQPNYGPGPYPNNGGYGNNGGYNGNNNGYSGSNGYNGNGYRNNN